MRRCSFEKTVTLTMIVIRITVTLFAFIDEPVPVDVVF